MYYVYELVNLLGTVEYVGRTINPSKRKDGHFSARGKFYKRQDISMHIVGSFQSLAESLQREHDLQVYWGLPTDRSKHSGSLHPKAKLNEGDVRKVKILLADKVSCAEIARRFNVTRAQIGHIKNGRAWVHLKV